MRSDTEAALAAALAVAREQGLPVGQPRVVRDLTNLLVHLAPAPVVARVPLTLSRLRPRSWVDEEIAVAAFLASAGAPVAPPADAEDPGPHVWDGMLVTLWRYIDHDPARFDSRQVGTSLRELHVALASYPGELPSFDRLAELGLLLDSLEPSTFVTAGELEALKQTRERLLQEPLVRGQPLHGDAHFGNVLWSPAGPRWGDLENVCVGPVEYDLACLAWRGAPGTAEALAAYGAHNADLLARLEPYLALFLAAWTIVVVGRAPTEGALLELRRRIERATAYARAT